MCANWTDLGRPKGAGQRQGHQPDWQGFPQLGPGQSTEGLRNVTKGKKSVNLILNSTSKPSAVTFSSNFQAKNHSIDYPATGPNWGYMTKGTGFFNDLLVIDIYI